MSPVNPGRQAACTCPDRHRFAKSFAAALEGFGVKGLYSYALVILTGKNHEGADKRKTYVRELQDRAPQRPDLRDLQQSAPQATPGMMLAAPAVVGAVV